MDFRIAASPAFEMARLEYSHGRLIALTTPVTAGPSPEESDTPLRERTPAPAEPPEADRRLVPGADFADLDQHALGTAVRRELRRRSSAAGGSLPSRHRTLTQLNVTDVEGSVRLAGLICFGSYPQQFFPRLVVDVRAYSCTSAQTPSRTDLLERSVCTGAIADMVDEAVAAIARNLRRRPLTEAAGLRDVPEFPTEALRELVANAVIHRDYCPPWTGQSITVDIFTDRIEILNPGGLWGGRGIESLTDARSICRNETLMSLASSPSLPVPDRPVAFGTGSGIGFVVHALAKAGLPAPLFASTRDSFMAALPRPAIYEHIPRSHAVFERTDGAEDARAAWAEHGQEQAGRSRVPREVRTARLLDELGPHTPKTVHELALAIDATEATVRRILAPLVADGTVTATAPATSRNRAYLKGPAAHRQGGRRP